MSDLLDLAIVAHGDLERWNTLRTVKLELSVDRVGFGSAQRAFSKSIEV